MAYLAIKAFWKLLNSVLKLKAMQLQGNGLSTALLIKVVAYLLALRVKARREFSEFSIPQLMRRIQRDYELKALQQEHFHLLCLGT